MPISVITHKNITGVQLFFWGRTYQNICMSHLMQEGNYIILFLFINIYIVVQDVHSEAK